MLVLMRSYANKRLYLVVNNTHVWAGAIWGLARNKKACKDVCLCVA